MEHDFWHERWRSGDIGFHRSAPNRALEDYWHDVGVAPGATVLVPLAGKSLDMGWLAERGYRVRGVELSPLAVDQFFAEAGLSPDVRQEAEFTVHTAGGIELWCGDLFALPDAAMADVAGVYDRASLVALPPSLRERYAGLLAAKLPAGVRMLLVSLAYDPAEMNGPPFSVPEARVRDLLEGEFEVEVLFRGEVLADNPGMKKRGLTALEEAVYRLVLRL